jgi:hypothetical protein
MLALITAAALGYWANHHIGFDRSEDGSISLQVDAAAIAADIRWFWSALIAVVGFAVATGKGARIFTDTVALPWIRAFGFQVPALPTLPALPTQDRLTT